jgi:hypothetical protein
VVNAISEHLYAATFLRYMNAIFDIAYCLMLISYALFRFIDPVKEIINLFLSAEIHCCMVELLQTVSEGGDKCKCILNTLAYILLLNCVI